MYAGKGKLPGVVAGETDVMSMGAGFLAREEDGGEAGVMAHAGGETFLAKEGDGGSR